MLPPAGWYSDPQDPDSLRFWDGSQWTDQTRPMAPEPAAPQVVSEVVAEEPLVVESVAVAGIDNPEGDVRESVAVEPVDVVDVVEVQDSADTAWSAADEAVVTESPLSFPGFAAEVAALDESDQAQDDDQVVADDTQVEDGVIVVTTADLPGHRIMSVIGQVSGVAVRARTDLWRDGADHVGLLHATRQEAVDRLGEEAGRAGATAVVAMQFDSHEIGDLMTEVVAYGTAVVIEKA